jgi:multimeric flavodoxin WrbA/putative sterol carrier protein
VFVRVNVIMTHTWSALFAVAVILSLYPSLLTRAIIPVTLILGFGLPFNLWFPDYYLRRLGLPSLAEQKRMAEEGLKTDTIAADTVPVSGSSGLATAWDAIAGMASAFNSMAAGNMKAIIGFHVTGGESFEAYLHIHDGICSLERQAPGSPDLFIHAPVDVWLAIATGRLSGQEAFIRRAYTAEGDLGILMRMGELFGTGPKLPPTDSKPETEFSNPAKPETEIADGPSARPQSRKVPTAKVLVLNSSPRTGNQSKTELMLNALSEGMREGNAEVEVVHLRTKDVKNCIGCYTCWTKTPGVCVIKDDMTTELFPKWAASDLVVYASPLYYFGVNAEMKVFVERTLPALQPFFEFEGGVTHHPWRIRHPKVVVLSVAGFQEYSVFDLLSQWVRFVFSGVLTAEIYRPAAEFLAQPVGKDMAHEILSATRQAGRELVTEGSVSPETMAAIVQPISTDTEMVLKIGNAMWKTCIREGITPREMDERRMIPRPDSVETFMAIMPLGFNADGAGDMKAIVQFDFSGDIEGSCHFSIENRTIKAVAGKTEKADLTLDVPFEVWMDIMTGKADGQQMFIAGKYRAVGDLSLLIRMGQLFGGNQAEAKNL